MFYIGLYMALAQGSNVLHRLIQIKGEKSFCLKPQGLEPLPSVCGITCWTSTKIVHIMPLGSKMAWPLGIHILQRLI